MLLLGMICGKQMSRSPKKVIKANTHRSRNTGLLLVTVIMRMKHHTIRREKGLSSQLHHITVEGEWRLSRFHMQPLNS
jgi:hypothetical protein